MHIAHPLYDLGKPAWIALMVLGFAVYWPIGLAILAFILWSGRMGCWRRGRWGRWYEAADQTQEGSGRWYVNQAQEAVNRWCGPNGRRQQSSGNRAFDEYRAETLKRLEEEEREFRDFLDRLRQAKDKAEFDQFMAERSRRPPPGAEPQPQA